MSSIDGDAISHCRQQITIVTKKSLPATTDDGVVACCQTQLVFLIRFQFILAIIVYISTEHHVVFGNITTHCSHLHITR